MGRDIIVRSADGQRIKTNAPVIDEFKGYVEFKRGNFDSAAHYYKSEFGFDWMREDYEANLVDEWDYAELEKEYAPVFKYNIEDNGYIRDGANANQDLLVLPSYRRNKSYYTPWFIGFHNQEYTLYANIELTSKGEGEIRFEATDANINVRFYENINAAPEDIGTGVFDTTGKNTKKYKCKILVNFNAAIADHAMIEARFYDKAGKKDKGDVIGAINVYKNNREYDLDVKFVKILFVGPTKYAGKEYVLDPVDQTYTHYTDKVALLQAEQAVLVENRDIRKKQREIDKVVREWTKAQEVDQFQINQMEQYRIMLEEGENINYVRNVFGQGLIRYNGQFDPDPLQIRLEDLQIRPEDTVEITAEKNLDYSKSYGMLFNRIHTAFYRTNVAVLGNVTYLFPVNLPNDNGFLGGKAEDATCDADDVIIGANIITTVEDKRPYRRLQGRTCTILHENLHTLTLSHTFPNPGAPDLSKQKHAFTKYTTENIMDYSDVRKSLWKWQIEKMHTDDNCDLVARDV